MLGATMFFGGLIIFAIIYSINGILMKLDIDNRGLSTSYFYLSIFFIPLSFLFMLSYVKKAKTVSYKNIKCSTCGKINFSLQDTCYNCKRKLVISQQNYHLLKLKVIKILSFILIISFALIVFGLIFHNY